MIELENHVLYSKPTCPYCLKVGRFMQLNGLTCASKNTLDPAARAELIEIGGMPQVPCLVIDGKAMYESGDIIAYLQGVLDQRVEA